MTAETLAFTAASLRERLLAAWDAGTASGDWRADRPSTGQCAVTALIVQDECGGILLRGVLGGASHYWNFVDGRELDLTRDQFEAFRLDAEPELRTREVLLANRDTARRYRRLRRRLDRAGNGSNAAAARSLNAGRGHLG